MANSKADLMVDSTVVQWAEKRVEQMVGWWVATMVGQMAEKMVE